MTQFNDTADLRTADLHTVLAAIAASPIVLPRALVATTTKTAARDFADWCALQGDDEIDTVILEWLRSQVVQPAILS
jgi:hypothetical protein